MKVEKYVDLFEAWDVDISKFVTWINNPTFVRC